MESKRDFFARQPSQKRVSFLTGNACRVERVSFEDVVLASKQYGAVLYSIITNQ